MVQCVKCGSHAINHHLHGRDGCDGDLCDVCYWRKRAMALEGVKLPCDVHLAPGLWLRKGVSVSTLSDALARRDDFERLQAAMTDEEREEQQRRFKELFL